MLTAPPHAPPSTPSLVELLRRVGKDPSRLVFEDDLTELRNRRYLRSYFDHQVRWETGEDYPLALLAVDLDHFKSVNDSHGHAVGDQALTWVASILGEVAGPDGIPVRYAGDEFMILLPGLDRNGGRRIAARLLQRARERPFRVRESGLDLPITMSVGVAAAPEDARDARGLLEAADTALYHSKQSGRDQASHAADVDPSRVFPKTALQRLRITRIGGRERELDAVAAALAGLAAGRNAFLLFEGAPGMGKTALLETVHASLAGQESSCGVRLTADPREEYRPFSLARQFLSRLLDGHPDGGAEILAELGPERMRELAHVLPRQVEGDEPAAPDSEAHGPALASVLSTLTPRLVNHRPLVLMIDDLHLADEATLRLFLELWRRDDLPFMVLGAAMEAAPGSSSEELPWQRFVSTFGGDLEIRRFHLEPLTPADIAAYLLEVFPQIGLPEGFVQEIARGTRGNPLFLSEVLRKLVADRVVVFEDRRWIARPIDSGSLPPSLEDVVRERISSLDAESRDMLERASAIGVNTPLSVLAGSAHSDEGRLQEAMDRAESMGLVRIGLDDNDEIVQFLGHQVRDITYEGIEDQRRTRIHEQIGEYAEDLYERGLLPSPSMVAWQYRQAGNQEKSRRYERLQAEQTRRLLGPEEMAALPAELIDEEIETERPLEAASVKRLPLVIRTFTKAVRDIQLYPAGSAAVQRSIGELQAALQPILEINDRLHVAHGKHALLVNGQRVALPGGSGQADALLELFGRAEIQGIAFLPDVDDHEVRAMVEAIGGLKAEAVAPGHWRTFVEERGLSGISIEQVRYSRVVRRRAQSGPARAAVQDTDLDDEDLARIPEILRSFMAATKASRLYPAGSHPSAQAIAALDDALQPVLKKRGSLTLAWIEDSLIANGTRVDTSGFEGLAESVIQCMTGVGLGSVSWTAATGPAELAAFVAALAAATPEAGSDYWDAFSARHADGGLVLNARQYSTDVVHQILEWEARESDAPPRVDAAMERAGQLEAQPTVTLLENLPQAARELMMKGRPDLVGRLIRGLLAGFRDEEPMVRGGAIGACRALLGSLNLGLQRDLVEIVTEPLLDMLEEESDPGVLREFGLLLHEMANLGIRFGDWPMASRILLSLRERRERLDRSGVSATGATAGLLDRPLDPAIQMLLVDVFRSRDPELVAQATKVLGGAGRPALPALLDVIRQEPELRVRMMAASLMAEAGWAGAKEIKRSLATEAVIEYRIRMLEVADRVTQDLGEELRFALASGDGRVRDEGLRLFHRLGRDDLVDLVVPYAAAGDPELARAAIAALGALGTAAAVAGLVTAQRTTENPDVVVASCQALGQAGSLAGVDALVRVLDERRRRLIGRGRRWPEPVRAAAAAALAQIGHPRAVAALERLVDDPHPWVRDVARGAALPASA